MSNTDDIEQTLTIGEAWSVDKAASVESEDVPFPANKNRKKGLVALLLLLALMGVAIGLGVGLGSNKSKEGSPSSAQQSTASLALLCGDSNNLDACELACEPAICCFNTSVSYAECLTSKDNTTCDDYAPCSVLNQETGGGNGDDGYADDNSTTLLEDPTSDVFEICNPVELTSGQVTCEEACKPAACCQWSGEDGCLDGNEETCNNWISAGCFLLGVDIGFPLEDPTSDVFEICNPVELTSGQVTCEEACKPAACCQWSGKDGCLNGNEETCNNWISAGCFVLGVNAENPLEPVPSNLTEACSFSFASDDVELSECNVLCEPASCCFDFYNICAVNASVCEQYAPCAVLFSAFAGDLADPPSGMQDICNADLVTCEELCTAAACCEFTGEESCLEGNVKTCGSWALAGCSLVAN